ncbi:hypothetical protein [Nocardia caishijiensis]|uniref:MYXO-CTERM domain-containing protein n=1 Tax=Nocardia caishijiensis TaxID=184756 RepID=A0ABQ6YRG6_9NOCA|nr:hypothetical protein [Nocardia caishijiensis]KAF0848382.1 hypothetical protein FNL39_102530 [Nocardia caishijiensis]
MADSTKTERRPAFSLLVTGLLALAVSGWALLGAPTPDGGGILPVGWGVVIVASVVGLLLVLSPRRKRR